MIHHPVAWCWEWPELTDSDLLVSADVADVLHTHRQVDDDLERGGLLFVSMEDPRGLMLARATPPHAKDRLARYSLELNPQRCRKEITQANKDGLRLVGHWHTHPQEVPEPSGQDLHSFREFGAKNRLLLEWPLAIIVGRSTSPEGIRAWSIRQDRTLLAKRKQAQI